MIAILILRRLPADSFQATRANIRYVSSWSPCYFNFRSVKRSNPIHNEKENARKLHNAAFSTRLARKVSIVQRHENSSSVGSKTVATVDTVKSADQDRTNWPVRSLSLGLPCYVHTIIERCHKDFLDPPKSPTCEKKARCR